MSHMVTPRLDSALDVARLISGLVSGLPDDDALQFWQSLRKKHVDRIKSGEAELQPALLRHIDEQIAQLSRRM